VKRISVIVPNYNRETMVGETLANLLAQTQPPYEIIVVDDGSTDKSVEVIRSFGSQVKLLQQANQGPGAARNAGLAVAEGDFIQFQDSDDLLSLNKLERQAAELETKGADIAFGPWAHVFIQDHTVKFESCVLQQALPPKRISLAAWLLRGWATVFQSLLFRRSFLINTGRYRTDVRYGEDMEFLFRLLSRSPRAVFAADTLTLYRVDAPNKLSHDAGRAKSRREADWAICLQAINAECRRQPVPVDRMTRWIFQVGIRKHLRYLHQETTAPLELIESLARETRKTPAPFLAAVELWLRLLERIRLSRTGYRWMPGYQAALPTPKQLKLLSGLGLNRPCIAN
jgi:glycosyltransferase involved in cell wall biosynthesis